MMIIHADAGLADLAVSWTFGFYYLWVRDGVLCSRSRCCVGGSSIAFGMCLGCVMMVSGCQDSIAYNPRTSAQQQAQIPRTQSTNPSDTQSTNVSQS